jgi:hypothetical protein
VTLKTKCQGFRGGFWRGQTARTGKLATGERRSGCSVWEDHLDEVRRAKQKKENAAFKLPAFYLHLFPLCIILFASFSQYIKKYLLVKQKGLRRPFG